MNIENQKKSLQNFQIKIHENFLKFYSKDWFKIGSIFIISRFVIYIIGIIAISQFPNVNTNKIITNNSELINPTTSWNQIDVPWYKDIALNGYKVKTFTNEKRENWAFMPLYPVIVGIVLKVLNSNEFFVIASLISNLLTFIATFWIYKQIKNKIKYPELFAVFLLFSSGSFYLSIPYTESLYLFLIAATWFFTNKKMYILGGLLAGLAIISRLQAMALVFIPFIALLQENIKISVKVRKLLILIVLFVIPLLSFMLYMKSINGDPFAYFNMQKAWGNVAPYPFGAVIGLFIRTPFILPAISAYLWILYLLILIRNIKKLPLNLTVFTIVVFLISSSTEIFYGANRAALCLFPIFMVLPEEKGWVQKLFLYSNLLILPIFIFGIVTGNEAFI